MMKTKLTLLVAGGLSAIVLSAPLAKAVGSPPPVVVNNLGGTLHILQRIPCNGVVDLTTRVRDGLIEMFPAERLASSGARTFTLTTLTLFFSPFRVNGECRGFRDPHNVTEIGVRLAGAVSMTVLPGDDRFSVTIPKEKILIYESIIDNGVAKTAFERPSEDVTGTIDRARRIMQLHIVIARRMRFQAGCMSGRCVIDEFRDGVRTADIAGTIVLPRR